MSVKIRVSYNTDQEIAGVIRLLSPALKECKLRPAKGAYKRAYITLDSVRDAEGRKKGRAT